MANRRNSNSNKRGNKPNSKPRTSGRNKQNRTNVDDVNIEGKDESPINKTAWYVSSDATKQAVERVSFNNIMGEEYPVKRMFYSGDTGTDKTLEAVIPTLAVVRVNPSIMPTRDIGDTGLADNPLNRCANIAYVQWSALSGRTAQYAPADIAIYLLACGSVQELISHIRRLIGLMRYYSARNMTLPVGVLNALGLSDTYVTENQVLKYIDRLNYIIRLFNAIKFPKNLPYFEKCNEMYDNIYKDTDHYYSQMFAFIPFTLWELNETYSEAGSGLNTVYISDDNKTMDVLLSTLNRMVVSITTSTTQSLIGSDLLNFSIKKGLELGAVPEVPYDYQITPIYSAEACIHFHHARAIGYPTLEADPAWTPFTKLNDVTSVAGKVFVQYAPAFPSASAMSIQPVLDIDSDNPNIDEIVEARRYIAYIKTNPHTVEGTAYQGAGQMYLNDHYVVSINYYGKAQSDGTLKFLTGYNSTGAALNSQSSPRDIMTYSAFNHGPIMPYLIDGDSLTYFSTMNNLATLDDAYMTNVTRLEQMDLFTIQEMKPYISE